MECGKKRGKLRLQRTEATIIAHIFFSTSVSIPIIDRIGIQSYIFIGYNVRFDSTNVFRKRCAISSDLIEADLVYSRQVSLSLFLVKIGRNCAIEERMDQEGEGGNDRLWSTMILCSITSPLFDLHKLIRLVVSPPRTCYRIKEEEEEYFILHLPSRLLLSRFSIPNEKSTRLTNQPVSCTIAFFQSTYFHRRINAPVQ